MVRNEIVLFLLHSYIFQTRQLDLGSNNISNLYEFRNLCLNNLEILSVASNQVKKFFLKIKFFMIFF
jgi:hypothetical protein